MARLLTTLALVAAIVFTGTISEAIVRQPNAYQIQLFSGGLNPGTSAATRYGGNGWASATDGQSRVMVTRGCVLRSIYFNSAVLGTLSTGEDASLYLRVNSTDLALSVALETNTATAQAGSFTNLAIPISAGATLQIKVVTTGYATAPTTWVINMELGCDLP